jgi:hypothetical protein
MTTKIFASIFASVNGFCGTIVNLTWLEWLWFSICGIIGWLVGEFTPAFPLLLIAFLFVLYDAWSAYELDKRVHQRYPDKTMRHQAKFVSYKFRFIIPTLTERMVIIILAYCCERWVFVHVSIPISYIAAAVVCAEQSLSIAENKASCRMPGDKHARLWKMLARVLIDKTERHFDINFGEDAHRPIHGRRYGSRNARKRMYNDSDIDTERPGLRDIEPYDDRPNS